MFIKFFVVVFLCLVVGSFGASIEKEETKPETSETELSETAPESGLAEPKETESDTSSKQEEEEEVVQPPQDQHEEQDEEDTDVTDTQPQEVHAISKRAIRIRGYGYLLNRYTVKCESNKKCKSYCKRRYDNSRGRCLRLKTRTSNSNIKTRKVCACRKSSD